MTSGVTPRPEGLAAEIAKSEALWRDFHELCALGGRLCGTPSEVRARALLGDRLIAIADARGGRFSRRTMPYEGWAAGDCRLRIESPEETEFPASALLRSPPTPADGLVAEVVDLGRGAFEDFQARRQEIPGRMVLVRHEYMFSTDHIHRSRKFAWALEHGAAAFLIAGAEAEDGPVAGGAGFAVGDELPAAGIGAEAARRLAPASGGRPRARLFVDATQAPAETETLILDLPGGGPEWVVLSAHLDGHALAQSAIDNATGVAAALAAARALAPHLRGFERGLRVCFFSAEEWGLLASQDYVESLSAPQRDALVVNINLDSVAGSPNLAALTSGFAALEPFLAAVADRCGVKLGIHRPMVANSDHYNFAIRGIPAFRLVAGFNEPDSRLRHVLTRADTEDKVSADELRSAAILATALAARACADASLRFRTAA